MTEPATFDQARFGLILFFTLAAIVLVTIVLNLTTFAQSTHALDIEDAKVEVEQTKAAAPTVAPVVQDERLWNLYDECVETWRGCSYVRTPREHYDQPKACVEKVDTCGRLLSVMQGARY